MGKKWWYGSGDTKNVVISDDKGDLPAEGAAAPLNKAPTARQLNILRSGGMKVRVIENYDSSGSAPRTSSSDIE